MEKSKIDWCDSTWNPVTGCLHGCEYCYARGIATRFGGNALGVNHVLNEPFVAKGKVQPYPFGFVPTFHRYRLNEYSAKQGRNILVCSMADLFGKWVPDNWIEEVFEACEKAPQHNYLFLTKNPGRYVELAEKGVLRCSSNMWYGWSETSESNRPGLMYFPNTLPKPLKTFVSVEPILEPFHPSLEDWIIVGAETGRRKYKVIPKREWPEQIVKDCREYNIPIFMKSSLAEIWGESLIQQFPKELQKVRKVNV